MKYKTSFFVIGQKDNNMYYISNVNPLIWTDKIENAREYSSKEIAMLDINSDVTTLISQINLNILDSVIISKMVYGVEVGRLKVL